MTLEDLDKMFQVENRKVIEEVIEELLQNVYNQTVRQDKVEEDLEHAETIEEIAEYIEKTEVKNDTEYWKDEHNIGEMDGFPWGVGFNDRGQTGPSEEVE